VFLTPHHPVPVPQNRLAKIGTGFISLVENLQQQKSPAPAFIGRRRRVVAPDGKEVPPPFIPRWQFNTDPEHTFRITVLSETKQPFTPPPSTTAAWNDDELSEPEAVWCDDVPEPDMDAPPESPTSPTSPPPYSESEKDLEGDTPTASTTVHPTWTTVLHSPVFVHATETHETLVPWVVRPVSPINTL